jgi:hypothetical protein
MFIMEGLSGDKPDDVVDGLKPIRRREQARPD